MSVAMAITTIGTALGVLHANMTLDVIGNIALALPLVTVPFVCSGMPLARTGHAWRPRPNSPWSICPSPRSAS
jgi:hypothetical protein